MDEELHALESNHTWIIVDLAPEKIPIGKKGIYKIKYHANGTVDRFKA